MALSEYAKTFFERLKKIEPEKNTPIFFVCHSLGGLILKQIVEMASGVEPFGDEGKKFLRRIAGVVFYGTPHGGSTLANIGLKLSAIVWPTRTITYLARNNRDILQLNSDYRNIVAREKIAHLIVYEQHPTFFGTIVQSGDSDPGITNAKLHPGEGNHFEICKPPDRGDQRYSVTRDFIADRLTKLKISIQPSADGIDIPAPPSLPPMPGPPIIAILLRVLLIFAVPYVVYHLDIRWKTYDIQTRLDEVSSDADSEQRSAVVAAEEELKSGNLARAEAYVEAIELARKLKSEVKFAVTENQPLSPNGWVTFPDGWDARNIITVQVPQLAEVPSFSGQPVTAVRLHRGVAKQFQAAFAEIEAAGLMDEISLWCGSFVPRTIKGSSSVLSDHALGIAFDLNCDTLRRGKPFDPKQFPDFMKVVDIFGKHGFAWYGVGKAPDDPMHFQAFRLDGSS